MTPRIRVDRRPQYVKNLDTTLGSHRASIKGLEQVKRYLHLRRIEKTCCVIVRAGACGLHGGKVTAALQYVGKAKIEEDARGDLADIMKYLHVIFEDLQPESYYMWDDGIGGIYGANAPKDSGIERVTLSVPWIPVNCKVVERLSASFTYKTFECPRPPST